MKSFNNLTILAIDTSCDDTCIAILKIGNWKPSTKAKLGAGPVPHRNKVSSAGLEFLSNVVSSQVKLHEKYGGVYPSLAKREHQKNLPIVLEKAKKEAKNPNLDLIAVTIGPGLEPCLWTGVNFAKALSYYLNLPLVPVNHIEAHILANFLTWNVKQIIFPTICLVVSGGHTQLILMKEFGKYKIIGETRDDAAGECFDKVARILGLGYPGGPAIEAEASKLRIQNSKFEIQLPRPMIHQKNFDFSFSGLKTAVLYDYKNRSPKIRKLKRYVQEMSFEVQQAIIDVLISKTIRASKEYRVKTIILGGGVAANNELRKQFKVQSLRSKVNFLAPPKVFCTDNAAMVAVASYFHWLKGEGYNLEKIKANANLKLG